MLQLPFSVLFCVQKKVAETNCLISFLKESSSGAKRDVNVSLREKENLM